MIYKDEAIITQETLNFSGIDDEYIFRCCLRRLIDNIPMEDIKKVFALELIDPWSDESIEKLKGIQTYSESEKMEIQDLQARELYKYKASIKI